MKSFKMLFNWYFSKKALPYWCLLLLDCIIVMFSGYVGAYLQEGGLNFTLHFWQFTRCLCLAVLVYTIFFRVFHTYSSIVRYSSYQDLRKVLYANLCATAVVALVYFILPLNMAVTEQYPYAIRLFGCMFGLSTLLMWVERIIVKTLFENSFSEAAVPVAIYGTKAGGISIANSIQGTKQKQYALKCFISDDKEMEDAYLMGCKVFLNGEGVAAKLTDQGVKTLLVSPLKSELFCNNQQMIEEVIQAGIRIMMMPVAEEWDGKSNLTHKQLHEVEIEDLLPREKIEVDIDAIGKMLKGKRILITGAAGSIGSEMARQVAKFGPAELLLVDQAETPMHDVRLYMANNHKELNCLTLVYDNF